jgi:hypothetical protein
MTEKLLPCPFCGSKAVYTEISGDFINSVNCTNEACNAEVAGFFLEDPSTVITWNTRTPPMTDVT